MICKRKFFKLYDLLQPERKISYLDWNESSEKIVFCVHALLCNARDFDYIARFLEKDYRVVCIDLAGRGESDYLLDGNRYTYETYISDIMQLVNALNFKNIVWIGSSLGAILGFYVNSINPLLISKFIVNDVGYLIPKKTMVKLVSSLRSFDFKEFYNDQEIKLLLKDMFDEWNISSEEHWEHIFEINVRKSPPNYSLNFDGKLIDIAKALPDSMPITEFNFYDVWKTISVPMLQFFGSKSDFVTQDMIEFMLNEKSQMRVVKSLNSGHICNFRNTDQIDLIAKWVNSNDLIEKFNLVD